MSDGGATFSDGNIGKNYALGLFSIAALANGYFSDYKPGDRVYVGDDEKVIGRVMSLMFGEDGDQVKVQWWDGRALVTQWVPLGMVRLKS